MIASRSKTASIAGAALAAALAVPACTYTAVPEAGEPVDGGVVPAALGGAEVDGIPAFLATIPDAEIRDLDLETALMLLAMPLSCLDRPHAAPRDRSTYLDDVAATRRPGYERDRAFYGCWDWHSAVNSTWAMVRIDKEFPDLPISGLVREKLNEHLSESATAGELAFFEENRSFERTYGWAWLLKLYAELRTWDDPDAAVWADNLQPLAEVFSERTIGYLESLDRPSRSGAHSNTAFSLAMMLEYARALDDVELEEAITGASRRLFLDDLACPIAYEPWAADFLSPCLEEAALMAAVLEPEEFAAWFDGFMPAPGSREFLPLTRPGYVAGEPEMQATGARRAQGTAPDAGATGADERGAEGSSGRETTRAEAGPAGTGGDIARAGEATAGEGDDAAAGDDARSERQRAADESRQSLASRSHLIGLAFIRADAMNRIAAALPAGDPRAEAYEKLAAFHGAIGFDAMFDADYAGSHWIGTFALKYLLSERQ
ncbi:MAG TPA: DUF2891 family protein [Acidobacteriota bacterium]